MGSKDEENLWDTLEKKECAVILHQSIWESVREKLDFSKKKFKHKNIEIRKVKTKKGTFYILRDVSTNVYLKMNEKELFIFAMLDGTNSIRDISMAYIAEYNTLPFTIVVSTIQKLIACNFLEEKSVDITGIIEKNLMKFSPLYRIQSWFSHIGSLQVEVKNVDEQMTAWYQRGVHLFFTIPALIGSGGLLIFGGYCFETIMNGL